MYLILKYFWVNFLVNFSLIFYSQYLILLYLPSLLFRSLVTLISRSFLLFFYRSSRLSFALIFWILFRLTSFWKPQNEGFDSFSFIFILLWGSNSFRLRLDLYDFITLNLNFWQFKCIELLQFHLCRLSLYFEWTLWNFKPWMRSQCFSLISCCLWQFSMWRFHFTDSFLSRWMLFCGWIITRSKLCVRGLNKFLLSILLRRICVHFNIVCIRTLFHNFSL